MLFQMNALDSLGQTALHRAALAGHLQTCRLLLSYGSDPSIISLQGFTAAQMGNEAVQQILSGEFHFPIPSPPGWGHLTWVLASHISPVLSLKIRSSSLLKTQEPDANEFNIVILLSHSLAFVWVPFLL